MDKTIPANASGNVQSDLASAITTGTCDPNKRTISTGNQTIPLNQVGDFFSSNVDLSITKSDGGSDPVAIGSSFVYTLEIKNNNIQNSSVANGITVTDNLSTSDLIVGEITYSNGASNWIYIPDVQNQKLTFTTNSLGIGETVTITIQVSLSGSYAGSTTAGSAGSGDYGSTCTGDLTNKVSVATISNDINSLNNSFCQPTNVVPPAPALSLTKSALPATYSTVGQVITYSYVIKNTGNVTLTGTFSVNDDKATVTVTQPADGALSPNETCSATATYTITQADLDGGSVKNTATASGGGATSDEATATVTATQSPALSLVKTATPATYSTVGQVITYSYVIKNTGNVTLTGTFSVNDDKATVTVTQPADGALSPNETCSATATYTITQADLDGGSVKNTATASGGGATSDEATATVTATQSPALSLVKTATPATYSTVGQVITYSYVIKNTGNVTLTGPSV